MDSLLDFTRDLNVELLDQVVEAFYSATSSSGQQESLKEILTQFQEHPEAWMRVPDIIQTSVHPQTKYIGLQILERLIGTRWKTLPEPQRQEIGNFLTTTFVSIASEENSLRTERPFVNKLNLALVQVLKHEWPDSWPSFIPDLVDTSRSSLSVCENAMLMLKVLFEEIYTFNSRESLTTAKTVTMKKGLAQDFSYLLELCIEVLRDADSSRVGLINATMGTLRLFMTRIPAQFFMDTSIIDILLQRFLDPPEFRSSALMCFVEIVNNDSVKGMVLVSLFNRVMESIQKTMPLTSDFNAMYEDDEELILSLTLFLTGLLSSRLHMVESRKVRENAHAYLLQLSRVEELKIFKICLEYWTTLALALYKDNPERTKTHLPVLAELRNIVIERMAKPGEFLIIESETGEIIREYLEQSSTIALHNAMSVLIVNLTHLDDQGMLDILRYKISKQFDGSEWSWQKLNALCWSIGCISGAISVKAEKDFVIWVVRKLLALVLTKRDRNDKIFISANLMYIVGQYPRFLKNHWHFLKVVVLKLFEFMHDTHEGVRYMACETFLKLTLECETQFVIEQKDAQEPFIVEVLRMIPSVTSDLTTQQTYIFYKAVGCMAAAEVDSVKRDQFLAQLMAAPNSTLTMLTAQVANDVSVLDDVETVKTLANVVKTNMIVCEIVKDGFKSQIIEIFNELMGLYRASSEAISKIAVKSGSTDTPHVRCLRALKVNVLELMEGYICYAEDIPHTHETLIPPLLEAILVDYSSSAPEMREQDVLLLLGTIVYSMKSLMEPQIDVIFDAVFEPTLRMITKDAYPEHQVRFFGFLGKVVIFCFPALLQFSPDRFTLYIKSMFWAMGHTDRNVADLGFSFCHEVLIQFSGAEREIASTFFKHFLPSIIEEIFSLIANPEHKEGFPIQAFTLFRVYQLINEDDGRGSLRLSSSPEVSDAAWLSQYCSELLINAIGDRFKSEIDTLLLGMTAQQNDMSAFMDVISDFLVRVRELWGEGHGDLFAEKREKERGRTE